MTVLFVYDNMYSWGGIQTLLARLIPALRAKGHRVALLTRPRGEPHDATDVFVERIARDADVHVAGADWTRPPRGLELGHLDVVVPCNLEALLLTAGLGLDAKVVVGVNAPREYCWQAPLVQRRWRQHLTGRILRRLPADSFMFVMDAMARQTGACLGRDLSGSPVLPIAIDTERLRPAPNRLVDRTKIASVTRLAPYYTHHAHVIRALRDLPGFTYHAYGDGDARAELDALARSTGVDDRVFLHGSVHYDEFADAVGDAFVYVGLSTGLIEAAACGVPALVGIDAHREPTTYGFVHETEGNDLGGYVPGHPEYPIADRIRWLAERTEDEYRKLENASRARAEEFSLTALTPRLVEILAAAPPASPAISRMDRLLGRADARLEALLWKLGLVGAPADRHLHRVDSG